MQNETELEVRTKELRLLITAWAEEKRILGHNEVLEVDVRIKRVPPVSIRIEGYQSLAIGLDEMLISALDLSVRAEAGLENANIRTVGEVRKKTRDEMRHIRNFGLKSVRDVQEKLHGLGIIVNWC